MTRTRTAGPGRWLWPLLAVAIAIAPAFFWSGGVVEEEALSFLRNFWGDRPVFQRIFETREFDDYQGRELSYAIDCLDAQWVRGLLNRGVLLFVPASVLLASIGLVAIGLWLVPRALPDLERHNRWLPLLLYLSNFAVASTTGLLYRATKPLVAPLLLVLLLLVLAEVRRPRLGRSGAPAAVFTTALVMSLLDRQGLFYLLLIFAALVAWWLRTRRGLPLVLGSGAAIAAWFAYDYAVGPWLIHRLNGYWPEMGFQRLEARWLLASAPWIEAGQLLGDWTRVLAGDLPPLSIAAAAAAGGAVWAWRQRDRPGRVVGALAVVTAALAAQAVMIAVMVARYRPITWIDHRFWYYPLPFQALLVCCLLWGLERATVARHGALPRVVPAVLAALVVSNLAHWPERRLIMQSGPWFSEVARRSDLLVRSLRAGRAEPLLDGEYRRFYWECLDAFPRFAARADNYVAEGRGVGLAEIRDGRVVAAAERQAHLVLATSTTGRYRLDGQAILRPGGTLAVSLGRQPIAEISGSPEAEKPVRLQATLQLGAGRSDLVLVSRLKDGRSASGERTPRGFTLLLPVRLIPEPAGPGR